MISGEKATHLNGAFGCCLAHKGSLWVRRFPKGRRFFFGEKGLRQHRIILVRRLRSQNFRQIGQKPQAILYVYYRGFLDDMTEHYASKMRAVNYAVLP